MSLRQFHILPSLLHSQPALPNSYPNASVPRSESVCTIFMIVFGMTQPGHEPTAYHSRPRCSAITVQSDKISSDSFALIIFSPTYQHYHIIATINPLKCGEYTLGRHSTFDMLSFWSSVVYSYSSTSC